MDQSPKPGWQTTEFWTPILALVVSALVSFHYLPGADAPTVMGYLTAIVTNVVGLGGSLVLLLHYVESRTRMKEDLMAMTREAHTRMLDCADCHITLPPPSVTANAPPCSPPEHQWSASPFPPKS